MIGPFSYLAVGPALVVFVYVYVCMCENSHKRRNYAGKRLASGLLCQKACESDREIIHSFRVFSLSSTLDLASLQSIVANNRMKTKKKQITSINPFHQPVCTRTLPNARVALQCYFVASIIQSFFLCLWMYFFFLLLLSVYYRSVCLSNFLRWLNCCLLFEEYLRK